MNLPSARSETEAIRNRHSKPRHRHPQWRRRVVKWTAALGTGLLVSIGALAAVASPGDSSTGTGTFLSGSLLSSIPLSDVAGLGGATATNPGNPTPVTQTSSLDLTALNAVQVTLPNGLDIPFGQFIQLGVVNQYAQASDAGVSRAASGAVGNDGAVDLNGTGSFPADASVDLTKLLGTQTALSAANLHLGAVTGVAALGGTGTTPAQSCADLSSPVNCRDYNIANADLNLTSPLVGNLVGSVNSTLDTTSATVNGLSATLQNSIVTTVNSVASALTGPSSVNVSLNVDLRSALSTVLSGTLSQGGVTLDLSSGAITVDLDTVIGGLNNRAPNTPLLSATVINAVVSDIDGILQQLQTNVNNAVTTALDNAAVGITASFCEPTVLGGCTPSLTGGELDISYTGTLQDLASGNATIDVSGTGAVPTLLAALGTPLASTLATVLGGIVHPVLTSAISDVSTAVTGDVSTLTSALDPVLSSISTVIGATLNVQEGGTAAGSYREVALRVSLLAGAGATVDLGRAEVGPNVAVPASITSISPNHGPEAGGTSVTITGSGFTAATGVTFGGDSGTAFTVVDDSHITVTTPAHAPGAVGVVVQSPNGDSSPGTFTYDPAAAITGLTPTSGPETGGTIVTITGSGFTGATGVTFGGDSGTSFTVNSDTKITVTTPAHAPGAVGVVVQSPNGDSAPGTFTYTPVTTVTGVNPGNGPEAGGTTVTITGQCFTGATSVLFGSTPATSFTVDSPTQITAVAPAGTGTVDVTVVGAGTCGTGTDPGGYTYNPAPAITSLSPDQGPVVGGTVVTITGSHFTGATGVTFDGLPGSAFSVDSDGQITVTTPAHVAGPVDVVVQSPNGDTTDPGAFTYVAAPVIQSVSPDHGSTAGGTSVTITGSGFTGATDVTFGGTPATSFTVDSGTQITAVTPAHAAGLADVTVTAVGGTSAPGTFTFIPPAAITSLAPTQGPETGGTTVTISGSGFTNATAVTFGGVPGGSFTVQNDSTITVTTPVHAPGAVDVVVDSPYGNSSPGSFTFTPVTTITGVSPGSGPESGGTSVTITGKCFTGATAVTFGGVPATSFTVDSDTQITAIAPAGTGLVDVTVVGAGTCGTGTAPGAYEYVAAPVIQSVTPGEGPTTGGTVVTITGTGFTGATSVDFGGTAATSFTVDSDTQITATTPAHAAGQVDVAVTTAGGPSGPGQFVYVPPASITSIAPSSGPETGGTTVTITGSGFTNATGVAFGNADGSNVTVVSDTELTVTTPRHAPGAVDVVVKSPFGDSQAGAFTFTPVTTITGVDPGSGPTSGGTTVTISGRCFRGATQVLFGSTPATSFTVVNDSTITAVTPAGTGKVDVTVVGTANCGTSTMKGGFTYLTPAQVLAATGEAVLGLGGLLAALGLLAAGIVLMILRRRRSA